jgi:hypothetical protein
LSGDRYHKMGGASSRAPGLIGPSPRSPAPGIMGA